jgi:hypothetical protein
MFIPCSYCGRLVANKLIASHYLFCNSSNAEEETGVIADEGNWEDVEDQQLDYFSGIDILCEVLRVIHQFRREKLGRSRLKAILYYLRNSKMGQKWIVYSILLSLHSNAFDLLISHSLIKF